MSIRNETTPPNGTESRERPGQHLSIARLLSPRKLNHPIASIVGIPFESNQLQACTIEVNGQKIPLLNMMQQQDLIGPTKGVPHMSVGGVTTQFIGLFGHYEWRTSELVTNATRAYLVEDGIGVQGTGLTQYTPDGKLGFGLDMPFMRHSSRKDVGGGVETDGLKYQLYKANELWLLASLEGIHPNFARILKIFDYQNWLEYSKWDHHMNRTSIVVREDGIRELPKGILVKGVWKILPLLTDFFRNASDFSMSDGHNAFVRNGEIIFTDYEQVDRLFKDYAHFMITLGDQWYVEELRKQFSKFTEIYGLRAIGSTDYKKTDTIYERVSHYVNESYIQPDLINPVKKKLAEGDPKALVRYAMVGVIASRALGREIGRELLHEQMQDIIKENSGQHFTLQGMKQILNERLKSMQLEKGNHLEETCRVIYDEHGNLAFDLTLNTFGLPIENHIIVPVTHADIYQSWPWEGETQTGLIPPTNLDDYPNPFKDVADDLFSKTMYAQVAGALANIKGLTVFPESKEDPKRLEGYDTAAYENGQIRFHMQLEGDPLPPTTFLLGESMQVICNGSDMIIQSATDLSEISMEDLNKYAYIIHVASEYLRETTAEQAIKVSLH